MGEPTRRGNPAWDNHPRRDEVLATMRNVVRVPKDRTKFARETCPSCGGWGTYLGCDGCDSTGALR